MICARILFRVIISSLNWLCGAVVWAHANKAARLGSIPRWVTPKICQTVLAACPSSLVLGIYDGCKETVHVYTFKFDKNSTNLVFRISIWGLGALLGGIGPPKPPRGDGTASSTTSPDSNILGCWKSIAFKYLY